jgi:hypothetical protein
MFCVIYRFDVKAGEEERFTKAWSEVTKAFIESSGALGSRLHMVAGQGHIAYAQWPSREVRDQAELPESVKNGAMVTMRDCCDSIETLYELTPTRDHLIPIRLKGDGALQAHDSPQ